MVNAVLISSGFPMILWGEAVLTTAYMLNIPLKDYEKMPYDILRGRKPSDKHMKVWGYLAKVSVTPSKRTRLRPKTTDCVFKRHSQNSNTHKFMVFHSKCGNTIM